ncbi:hypothetical protein Nepgr_008956 [Nepenthes gracilis]|uniref:Uncharacterized protein n=1 Tax=Nepenthes gracilis TaxID=150966 RepID=A0AAD3SAJ5_NEPGR|nr:hypothetical protein Nepgr_008956 [Nepenthes gracilis]
MRDSVGRNLSGGKFTARRNFPAKKPVVAGKSDRRWGPGGFEQTGPTVIGDGDLSGGVSGFVVIGLSQPALVSVCLFLLLWL